MALTLDASSRANLSVRDFGPGVAEEHLAHLAEPFYRAGSVRQRAAGRFGPGPCQLATEAHRGELRI